MEQNALGIHQFCSIGTDDQCFKKLLWLFTILESYSRQFSTSLKLGPQYIFMIGHGGGGTIAQWIRLHLSSWGPGFEPLAHHRRFFIQILSLCWEKDENKQKRGHVWRIC